MDDGRWTMDERPILYPESAMDPAISLLRDLVAIDSVNPSLVAGAAGEAEIGRAIEAHMRRIGLDVVRQPVDGGRANIIGVLEGRTKGRSLMFCGHMDTVGVDGMAAPFAPEERDGRVYGRGAQDMKGGLAAMIDAARVVASTGFDAGRLVVAAVIDEEYESRGADALVRAWKADAGVVTEPTDLQIAVAHKGFAWFDIETRGRAAHGSRPADGRDAILYMGRILAELESLNRRLQAGITHPLLGAASLHASTIQGGRELSSYPDHCALKLERRTIPSETVQKVWQELDDMLGRLRASDTAFEAEARLLFSRPPYEVADGHPIAQTVARAAQRISGRPQPFGGMSFWTDAAVLGEAGIPSVLYGPGGGGLHSTEEFVVLEDVLTCRDVLAELADEWCRKTGTSAVGAP
jgi:acetylornithine deacetylase